MRVSQQLIDIDLFPNRNLIYTGYCIKNNRQILILINYDKRNKRFEGFTIFRQREIVEYRNWNEKEISKIKLDNRSHFINMFDFDSMNTFYSCFKVLFKNNKIIAFFIDNITESYYEGKIIALNREYVTIKLIDEKGKWTRDLEVSIKNIDYFSFSTEYEEKLAGNST